MSAVLLVFHLIISVALVGIILIQRSEGGGLGIGGGQGGVGSFASVRGTANFLTRTTAILATLFIITSLTLAILAKTSNAPKSILDVKETPPVVDLAEDAETITDKDDGDGGELTPTEEKAPEVPTSQ